jgi:hypothetical protein
MHRHGTVSVRTALTLQPIAGVNTQRHKKLTSGFKASAEFWIKDGMISKLPSSIAWMKTYLILGPPYNEVTGNMSFPLAIMPTSALNDSRSESNSFGMRRN